MKKIKGLTNRIIAMLMSGMLVVGAVPGTVLASESQADIGRTSEIAAEVPEGTDTEEVSVEEYSEDAVAQEEEAEAQYYTVTLDANGGYFENEWDDALGETVEKTEVVEKHIPIDGIVATFPVFTDPDGRSMVFAGWTLERDGELVAQAEEEYVPVDNCVLYAVWEAEDASEGKTEGQDVADQGDTTQETDTVEETETAQQYEDAEDVEKNETEFEDTEKAEDAQEYEETADEADTTQEIATEDGYVQEDTASDEYTASEVENEQDGTSAQEVIYSEDEEQGAGEESSDASAETNFESSEEEENVREDAAMGVVASGACGNNLTWTLDDTGTLTISGTGEMNSYNYDNGAPWLSVKSKITNIIINKGVSTIGNDAFDSCENVTSVNLPNSLTRIGEYAFAGCLNLTDIYIPYGVTSIGRSAFAKTGLKSVYVPGSVSRITNTVFLNCKNLDNVILSEGVTYIGNNSFAESWIERIMIPSSVNTIEFGAFRNSSIRVILYTGSEQNWTDIDIDSGWNDEALENVDIYYNYREGTPVYYVLFDSNGGNFTTYGHSGKYVVQGKKYGELKNVIRDGYIFDGWYTASSGGTKITSSTIVNLNGNQTLYAQWTKSQTSYTIEFNPNGGSVSITSKIVTNGETYGSLPTPTWRNYNFVGWFTSSNGGTQVTSNTLVNLTSNQTLYARWNNIKLSDCTMTISPTSYTYDGTEKKPTVTIKNSGTTLTNNTDYTVSYSNNTNAGTGTVTATGKGNYTGTISKTFTIGKASPTLSFASSSVSKKTTDSAFTNTLTKKTDGTVTFSSSNTSVASVNSSSGLVTIKGAGSATITANAAAGTNYNAGSASYSLTVSARSLSDCTMTISPTSYTYDGKAKKPTVTIKYNSTNLTINTDYTVSYSNNTNAGTGTVTATGKGSYSGTLSKTFTIGKASPTLSFASSSISKKTTDSAFTNTLTKKTDGTVTFSSSNTSVATVNSSSGLVTIKGAGSATITANAAAGTNYNAGSASYTINVVQNNNRYLDASDIFSFANSYSHFGYSNYYVSDKDFLLLANYVRNIYKNNPDYADSVINDIQDLRNSSWGGSCYGMAAVTILDKLNAIGFNENFDPTAKTMSEVHSPANNISVKSAINYYMLAQKIPYLRIENVKSYYKGESDWRAGLKQLVSMAQEGTPILFCYWFSRGGHAIVIKGYERAADGGHNIIAYDNRYPNRDVVIYVDSNYSKCTVDENENAMCIEYVKNMSAFDAIDIDGVGNQYKRSNSGSSIDADSSSTQITVRSKGKITVENAEGQTLVIDNGTTSGTMEIANQYMIVGETENGDDNSGFTYLVSNSDSFTFESDNGEIDASIVGSGVYGSAITSGADYVVISSKSGVYALGNDFSYALSLAVNNDMCDMVSIDGNANNDVKLLLQGNKVKATGIDTDSGIVTVYSNTIDTDTYSYQKGYRSIVIKPSGSGEAGDVDIMGSSQENGIYDTNIGIKDGAANISSADVIGILNKTYNGKAQTQNLTVKMGTMTLESGTDYTVSYKNNTNAGTATVSIAGKGNYKGIKTVTFKINKAGQVITVKSTASSIAVGKTTTVSITGNKGTKSFKSSNTAVATVSSTGKVTAKKVGKVTITATSAATANYKAASKTVTIKVVPAATTSLKADNQATGIKLTWKKVAGANAYFIYRGSTQIAAIRNGATVTYTDKKANTNGTKYTYKIIASASATGRSTLSKSVTTYCVARPAVKTLTNSAASKMTVKWGKNAKATGYQIQYCPDKTFKTGNKSVSITSASTVSKVIGSLTKGKTYYVRIRTYKTAGSTKYFSAWSSVKSVKISK